MSRITVDAVNVPRWSARLAARKGAQVAPGSTPVPISFDEGVLPLPAGQL